MKTKSLLSYSAAASLVAFIVSLILTRDITIASGVMAIAMAGLSLVHEYAPRTHFMVTPPVGVRPAGFSRRGLRSARQSAKHREAVWAN